MKAHPKALALLLFVAVLGAGCTEDLESITEITKSRVLGARFTADDGSDRAWPMPGEQGTVVWTVVDEAEPRPRTFAFAVCRKSPTGTNPFCAETPFSFITRVDPILEPPAVRFTTPANLGEGDEVLVLGLICANGVARFDPQSMDATCDAIEGEDPPIPTPVVFALPVADGSSNQHPRFRSSDISLKLGDISNPWLSPLDNRVAGSRCDSETASPELPHVSLETNDKALIEFQSRGSNFELYRHELGESLETITVSGFSTAGRFARSLSTLDTKAPVAEVKWTLPDPDDEDTPFNVDARGTVVAFYFLARDGRGGLDVGRRDLCVFP